MENLDDSGKDSHWDPGNNGDTTSDSDSKCHSSAGMGSVRSYVRSKKLLNKAIYTASNAIVSYFSCICDRITNLCYATFQIKCVHMLMHIGV